MGAEEKPLKAGPSLCLRPLLEDTTLILAYTSGLLHFMF